MSKTPTILLRAELVFSALALLSAPVFAFVAFRGEHYFMLASEALILVAGVFGVLAGRGRFPAGPAMAAMCVAGSIFTGAVLGGFETQVLPNLKNQEPVMLGAVFGRLGLAGLIAALGTLMILSRTPAASTKKLVWAVVTIAPVVALAAAWKLGFVARAAESLPEAAFQIGVLAVGMLVIVLVSIACHCAIRAFEIGVNAGEAASENASA